MINWELCKKFKFDQTIKSYMYKPESPGKWDTKFSGILRYKQKTKSSVSQQQQKKKKKKKKTGKKRTCQIVNFVVPVKIKESKKKDMYIDLIKELKKIKINETRRW